MKPPTLTYDVILECDNCGEAFEYEVFKNYRIKNVLKKKLFYCKHCGCELGPQTKVLEEPPEEEQEIEYSTVTSVAGALIVLIIGLIVLSTAGLENSILSSILNLVPVVLIIGIVLFVLQFLLRFISR